MSFLSYLVIIFGYIALAVFVLGMAYRIWNWGRLPTGFSWGLFPKPTRWTFVSVIWRAFAWPTLLRADKLLWIGAMLFHLGLLILFVGHLDLFVNILSVMEGLGISAETAYMIGVYAGLVAGIVLIFFGIRRISIARAKEPSSPADHFWLLLILLVVALGVYARLFHGVDAETAREFALSVLSLNPIFPPQNLWFLIHVFLAEILMILTATGKLVHFAGQFFTQYIIVTEKR